MTTTRTLLKTEKEDARKLTKQYIDVVQNKSRYWFMECVLAHRILYKDKEWERLGYNSVREYVEQEIQPIVGVSYGDFMRKAKLGDCIHRYGFKEKELMEIGVRRFRALASLLLMREFKEEMLAEVINKAKVLPSNDFTTEVIRMKTMLKTGVLRTLPTKYSFSLVGDQVEVLKEAFSIAKQLSGLEDANQLLIYICMDFIMNHTEEEDTASGIAQAVREQVASFMAQKIDRAVHSEHNYSGRRS